MKAMGLLALAILAVLVMVAGWAIALIAALACGCTFIFTALLAEKGEADIKKTRSDFEAD